MTSYLPFSGHWSTDEPNTSTPERKSTANRLRDRATFATGEPVSAKRVFDDAGSTTAVDPATLRPTTDRFTAGETESVEAWLINLVGSVATDESRWSRVQRRYVRTLRNTVHLILSGDYVIGTDPVIVGDVETATAYLHRTLDHSECCMSPFDHWVDIVTDRVATMRTRRADKARRRRRAAADKLKAARRTEQQRPTPVTLTPTATAPLTVAPLPPCCLTAGSVADCATHRPV